MMTHSESLAQLAPALVAASAELQHAGKDADNPFYRSRYATLEAVIDTVRPVFWKHGLTIVQGPGFEAGGLVSHEEATGGKQDGRIEAVGLATVTTMILHESGEWIMSKAGTPLSRPDPQGTGGALSYLRRYALAAMAGIGQEDDDANASSTPKHRSAPAGTRSAPRPNGASNNEMTCPVCNSGMWDNRENKTNPKSPDFKCRDKACGHAIWLGSWRDDTLKKIAEAVEVGAITAEQGVQAQHRIEGKDPLQLRKANEWLDGLAEGVAA